jgi:chromosome segregation ATPase
MPRSGDNNFFDHFERVIEANDGRLRSVEQDQAALKQEMVSLKADRCAQHDENIKELFKSRNELERGLERLSNQADGIKGICEGLDRTVESLHQKADALDTTAHELHAVGGDTAEKVNNLTDMGIPTKFQAVEDRVAVIERGCTESRKASYDYKFMLLGGLLGAILSIGSGVVVYYLTR